MCRSREIATRGKLTCNPRTRVTMGLLCCNKIIIERPVKKLINKNKGNDRYNALPIPKIRKEEDFYQMIKREDEEILLIIKMFMKCQ